MHAAAVEELTAGEPRSLVIENALRKARAVAGELVLGADTAVAVGGQVLGKPAHEEQAAAFLRSLAGREHEVWSGIALVGAGPSAPPPSPPRSRFRALGEAEIAWYLATGEWRDRAGGYAIQGRGAALVEGIEGDYLNVVGLPAARLLQIAPELLAWEA